MAFSTLAGSRANAYCYFKNLETGNFTESRDLENCWEAYETLPGYPESEKVHIACQKSDPCDMVTLIENPHNPTISYRDHGKGNFAIARKTCELEGGILPMVENMENYDFLTDIFSHTWIDLIGRYHNPNGNKICKGKID